MGGSDGNRKRWFQSGRSDGNGKRWFQSVNAVLGKELNRTCDFYIKREEILYFGIWKRCYQNSFVFWFWEEMLSELLCVFS